MFLYKFKEKCILFAVPRRFVNPNCGADWQKSGSSNTEMVQYVEPNSVNFYRIAGNYFFGEGSRNIKIKTLSNAPITVCYSRNNIQPRANQSSTTTGDVTCKQVTGQEYSFSLTDGCKDQTFIHDCVPYYFSVEVGKYDNPTICTGKQKYFKTLQLNTFQYKFIF